MAIMPINDYPTHNEEKFRLVVEQLETCRALIKSSSTAKARMATILLDNLAEILMYRHCIKIFSDDDFTKWIMPQHFPSKTRNKVLEYYNKKINIFQTNLKLISNTEADVLRIGHSYRNAAFHRDLHNARTISILARILFKSVCSLFTKVYKTNNATEGGFKKPLKWLSSYKLPLSYLNYSQAATTIAKKLIVGIQVTLPTARKVFASDLENRFTVIDELVHHELPSAEEAVLDLIIKWGQFIETFPEDEASQRYREVTYLIAQGKGERISRKEYLKLRSTYEQQTYKACEAFTSTLTWQSVLKLRSSIIKVKNSPSMDKLLRQYQRIDEVLSRIEGYLDQAAMEWDREIQQEIDIRRGK